MERGNKIPQPYGMRLRVQVNVWDAQYQCSSGPTCRQEIRQIWELWKSFEKFRSDESCQDSERSPTEETASSAYG